MYIMVVQLQCFWLFTISFSEFGIHSSGSRESISCLPCLLLSHVYTSMTHCLIYDAETSLGAAVGAIPFAS